MPGKGKKGGGLETKTGYKMKGTALYDKVKTRGGHTMMMKSAYKDKHSMMKDHIPAHDDKLMDPEKTGSAAFQHPMDAWGFPHGDENHRTPAEDVAAGQPVGGPTGKTPKKHMHGSAMNHPMDAWGFPHGHEHHRTPVEDVQGGQKPGGKTPKKHTRTSEGALLGEHTHGGTVKPHGVKKKK